MTQKESKFKVLITDTKGVESIYYPFALTEKAAIKKAHNIYKDANGKKPLKRVQACLYG